MKMKGLFDKILKVFGGEGENLQGLSESQQEGNVGIGTEKVLKEGESICPYCKSKKFVKLYLCRGCSRTFTAQVVKGRHYPTNLIIDALSYYNLGFGLEDTCRLINRKFNVNPGASTLGNWVKEYSSLCRYDRLRSFGIKMYK